jgi:quercetin dioxygenase-like cupin family protein
MRMKSHRIGRSCGALVAASLLAATVLRAGAQDSAGTAPAPQVIFSAPLPELPGQKLVVLALKWEPNSGQSSVPHRHPGSVFVYVTQGAANLRMEGQPMQRVPGGAGFFEPKGALHTVAESASSVEPAAAIAVMIVPDGAPLVLPATAGHAEAGAHGIEQPNTD